MEISRPRTPSSSSASSSSSIASSFSAPATPTNAPTAAAEATAAPALAELHAGIFDTSKTLLSTLAEILPPAVHRNLLCAAYSVPCNANATAAIFFAMMQSVAAPMATNGVMNHVGDVGSHILALSAGTGSAKSPGAALIMNGSLKQACAVFRAALSEGGESLRCDPDTAVDCASIPALKNGGTFAAALHAMSRVVGGGAGGGNTVRRAADVEANQVHFLDECGGLETWVSNENDKGNLMTIITSGELNIPQVKSPIKIEASSLSVIVIGTGDRMKHVLFGEGRVVDGFGARCSAVSGSLARPILEGDLGMPGDSSAFLANLTLAAIVLVNCDPFPAAAGESQRLISLLDRTTSSPEDAVEIVVAAGSNVGFHFETGADGMAASSPDKGLEVHERHIDPNGAAKEAGLEPRHVLVSVDGTHVANLDALQQFLERNGHDAGAVIRGASSAATAGAATAAPATYTLRFEKLSKAYEAARRPHDEFSQAGHDLAGKTPVEVTERVSGRLLKLPYEFRSNLAVVALLREAAAVLEGLADGVVREPPSTATVELILNVIKDRAGGSRADSMVDAFHGTSKAANAYPHRVLRATEGSVHAAKVLTEMMYLETLRVALEEFSTSSVRRAISRSSLTSPSPVAMSSLTQLQRNFRHFLQTANCEVWPAPSSSSSGGCGGGGGSGSGGCGGGSGSGSDSEPSGEAESSLEGQTDNYVISASQSIDAAKNDSTLLFGIKKGSPELQSFCDEMVQLGLARAVVKHHHKGCTRHWLILHDPEQMSNEQVVSLERSLRVNAGMTLVEYERARARPIRRRPDNDYVQSTVDKYNSYKYPGRCTPGSTHPTVYGYSSWDCARVVVIADSPAASDLEDEDSQPLLLIKTNKKRKSPPG